MKRLALLTLFIALLLVPSAWACEGGEKDAKQDAPEDPLDALLTRIEKRAAEVKTLSAALRYDRIQGLIGDKQRRFGTLKYQAGPPAKFAIHFDRLLLGQRMEKQDRRYIFDGVWLVERLDDKKQFIKRQVVPPDADPSRKDPLAVGEGPFPIPVKFNKADLLKRYGVSIIDPDEEKDPSGSATVHLRLKPKKPESAEVVHIDLWYDKQTLLPRRAATIDESENESIVELMKVVADEELPEKTFDTTPPRDDGWLVEIKPWEG